MRPRILPLICTGISSVARTRYFGSCAGQGSYARLAEWPRRAQSSSARCGASGASSNTNRSATARGSEGHLFAAFTNSMSAEIAVLKRKASISSPTFAIV